eukprot:TRINITY_DN67714_c8_g3_i1.p1 TRINITY_DN67714_c8_g3~~TRINITY_DN67714_c8_g3_i1.p1  ORF type:complete len:341 (+),score=16.34 TRINITY_DN67714_c8_g3_i1:44-1066(+)
MNKKTCLPWTSAILVLMALFVLIISSILPWLKWEEPLIDFVAEHAEVNATLSTANSNIVLDDDNVVLKAFASGIETGRLFNDTQADFRWTVTVGLWRECHSRYLHLPTGYDNATLKYLSIKSFAKETFCKTTPTQGKGAVNACRAFLVISIIALIVGTTAVILRATNQSTTARHYCGKVPCCPHTGISVLGTFFGTSAAAVLLSTLTIIVFVAIHALRGKTMLWQLGLYLLVLGVLMLVIGIVVAKFAPKQSEIKETGFSDIFDHSPPLPNQAVRAFNPSSAPTPTPGGVPMEKKSVNFAPSTEEPSKRKVQRVANGGSGGLAVCDVENPLTEFSMQAGP